MTPVFMKPIGQNSALGVGGCFREFLASCPSELQGEKSVSLAESGLHQTLTHFQQGKPRLDSEISLSRVDPFWPPFDINSARHEGIRLTSRR